MDEPLFASVAEVVRRRRSSLRIDLDRPVPAGAIERLCRLAVWAPNHKQTRPWRFFVLTGDARARLGAVAAESAAKGGLSEEAALAKLRAKYCRAPVTLVAASATHSDPVLRAENRDAVAAGIQNLLLGATAMGLASYWSTGATARDPAVKELLGLDPADHIVGIVYLGWPLAEAPPPEKADPEITYLND